MSQYKPTDLGSTDSTEFFYTIKENNVVKDFVLVEAGGDASTAYHARKLSGFKFDPKKGAATGEITEKGHDASLILVSKCLYELVGKRPDEGKPDERMRRPVSFDRIKSWPSRISIPLCEKVLFISKIEGNTTRDTINEKIAQLEEYKQLLEEDEGKKLPTSAGSSSDNGLVKTPTD